MLRAEPPCFVLIDYSGCTGDSVYPLHLGYGASGYGGVTHRPPTLESSPAPVRTAHGDYYRLARTILKQLYIGPEPSKRRHSDKDTSLPSHLDKELRTWVGERPMAPAAQPKHRHSPRAPGRTPQSPPPSYYMLRSGGRTGRSNRTRRPLPHRTPSLATPMVPWCRRVSPMMDAGNWQLGEIRDFGKILCSHHLPGDLPLAGLFQSGWLPRSAQPPSSSPSPHCPCGVFDYRTTW